MQACQTGASTARTVRNFTEADVREHSCVAGAGKIFATTSELIDAPLAWQLRGLQQTASGYGAKLTHSSKIRFEGKDYRLYVTCYGNAGSVWFTVKGRKIFVS